MAEGWSDAMVARRTGQPRTPYSVYIKGKKWKDFENDDHAEAVANKLKAKFKADGRDPETITIAPTEIITGEATALEKFRKAADEREKKHDAAEKEMKARHASGKEDMKGSIDRLEKHLNNKDVDEASFREYRKQNRDDILIAHQVPLSKIGGSDASNIAAALSQDRTFKEQVARPAQTNIEKMLNKVIREKTDVLEFHFNELTLTDEIAQSQILERYVRNQIMVPNEAREKLGLPQRPDGDSPIELSSRQAADASANARQSRSRDSERTANQSDGSATVSGRNPQGEGRSSE
jgi:hypothetical protein